MREKLRHPFWQAVLVAVIAYLVFEFGIAWLPGIVGIRSAPVPSSVVLQYMAVVIVGMLIYVSSDESRWNTFKAPIHSVMVDPNKRILRIAFMVLIPLLVGLVAFDQVRPTVEAPPALRAIHPAPPGQITFRGKTMVLADLENPLRRQGDLNEHYERGKAIYYQNCLPCHGDALAGDGHWASAFNPVPLSFRDNGTIAQLTESVVFYRIAKGGLGLPKEGTPWNSAMPAWEDFLTEEEIWAVIIFIYQQSGWQPRTWHEAGAAAEGGH